VALWRHVGHGLLVGKAGNRLTGEYERPVAAPSFGNPLIVMGANIVQITTIHKSVPTGLARTHCSSSIFSGAGKNDTPPFESGAAQRFRLRLAPSINAVYGCAILMGESAVFLPGGSRHESAAVTPGCYPSGGRRALGSARMVSW
jgi:hypothetical protein